MDKPASLFKFIPSFLKLKKNIHFSTPCTKFNVKIRKLTQATALMVASAGGIDKRLRGVLDSALLLLVLLPPLIGEGRVI